MSIDSTDRNVEPDHSVIVVSIPKAGTYLMAELLKSLGYRWTGLHLAEMAYSDYTGADLCEARQNPNRFARTEPLTKSLHRVQSGEFAVGHLPFKQDVLQATGQFKRLYLTRDLRTALISYMRFLHSTGRSGAAEMPWYPIADLRTRMVVFLATTAPILLQRLYAPMVGWSRLSGIPMVRFEDLTSDVGKSLGVVDRVARYLGVQNYNARDSLRSSLAAETITKSGRLTEFNDYWSPEAERRFREIGGPALDAQLNGSGAGGFGIVSGDPTPMKRAA